MGARDRAACLTELTRAFYERTYESFSSTRQNPWRGWEQLWDVIGGEVEVRADEAGCLRIADIACGNLRFVRFLSQKTGALLEVDAFDGCEPLLQEGLRAFSDEEQARPVVREKVCDIAAALGEGCDFLADVAPYDLAVTFGFIHHLPLARQRERLLRLMVDHVAEGGLLAASFWQFADDDRLREKAQATTARAQETELVESLAPDDYLLGWQDDGEALRFCHHFTESEIDRLSASLGGTVEEVTRFSADGKSGKLNRYVVWRRRG